MFGHIRPSILCLIFILQKINILIHSQDTTCCSMASNGTKRDDNKTLESDKEKRAVLEDLKFLLQMNYGSNVEITNCSIEDLVPFGTNFRSVVLKINIEFKRNKTVGNEEMHLVAKILPDVTLEISKNTNWIKMFKREIYMYTDVIPLYEKMELNRGMEAEETIAKNVPKLYGYRARGSDSKDNKSALILMENLIPQGYQTKNRTIGLDYEYSVDALKAIARFHGLGIVAKIENSSVLDAIQNKYRKPDNDRSLVDKMWDKFLEDIKSDPRFSRYGSRVEAIANRRNGNFNYTATCGDLWSTVIHYDLTVPNIMFHHDDSGKVDNVKLIDFQTYFFADLFIDLTYFIGVSINDEVKMTRLDELIDIYYETLIQVLQRMQVDVEPYTRQKFDDRFKEVAQSELLHCNVVLKMFTADIADKSADKETVVPGLMSSEGNDLYYEKLAILLQVFENEDWFR